MAKDYRLVAVIGFLVGWLVWLPAANLGFTMTWRWVVVSVAGFTLFAIGALWVLKYLARFWGVLEQFGKFAAVGSLNAFLDLGVLNLLILLSGIAAGWHFTLFKTIAFLVGKVSSYFWNKFWTFESRTKVNIREYLKFTAVIVGGMVINIGVSSLLVNVVGGPAFLSETAWANASSVIAILTGLSWNFLGSRRMVFRPALR